jgi:hypothetical protein
LTINFFEQCIALRVVERPPSPFGASADGKNYRLQDISAFAAPPLFDMAAPAERTRRSLGEGGQLSEFFDIVWGDPDLRVRPRFSAGAEKLRTALAGLPA